MAGNQPIETNKQTNLPPCFLSEQEDVLIVGWSVEVEAVQARVGDSPLGSGCRLVPQVRCCCDATVQLIGRTDQK